MDKTLIAVVFALIGALVGAGATARNRRLDAEARSRAALEAAVVEYVTALEQVLVSLDVLGLRDLPAERHVRRVLNTAVGHVVSAPMRLLLYFVFAALPTTRDLNRLRRAARRLALTADEALLREVKAIDGLLVADRKDKAWARDVLAATRAVTLAARRAISPRRSALPWRRGSTKEIERLLLLPAGAGAAPRTRER